MPGFDFDGIAETPKEISSIGADLAATGAIVIDTKLVDKRNAIREGHLRGADRSE